MSNEHPGIQLPEGLLPGVTFIPSGTFITFFVQKEADKETTARFFEELEGLLGSDANVSYDEKSLPMEADSHALARLRINTREIKRVRFCVRTLPMRRLIGVEQSDMSFNIIGLTASIAIDMVKCRGNCNKASDQTTIIRPVEPSKPKSSTVTAEDAGLTITVNGRVCSGKTTLALLLTRIFSLHSQIVVAYKNHYDEPIPKSLEAMEGLDLIKLLYGKKITIVDGESTPRQIVPTDSKPKEVLANASVYPNHVMGLLLNCPEWLTEDQRAGFKSLIEIMPTVISGLETGMSSIGSALGECVGDAGVELVVREAPNFAVQKLFDTVLCNAFENGHDAIGPFEIAFVEPDSTYNGVGDGWLSDSWYFVPPFYRRSAGHATRGGRAQSTPIEYCFRIETKSLRYGPAVRSRLQQMFDGIVEKVQ